MRTTIVSLCLAGLAVGTLAGSASAQPRHRAAATRATALAASDDLGNSSSALTVNRRSWLDPGNAVPRNNGSAGGQSYVQANTINNLTQDRIFAPDGFGNDVMKGQPYVPGRSHPILEGSETPDGRPVVDTALLPQNFYFNPAPDVP